METYHSHTHTHTHTHTATAIDGGVPCDTPCKEQKCMQNFIMKGLEGADYFERPTCWWLGNTKKTLKKKKLYLRMCTAVVWLRTDTSGGTV